MRLLLALVTLLVQGTALVALLGALASLLVLPWWESATAALICCAMAAVAGLARHRFA